MKYRIRSFCLGIMPSLFIAVCYLAPQAPPGHGHTARAFGEFAVLLWRYQGSQERACDGFSSEPLVDAVTAVSGDKLVLMEGSNGVCSRSVNLALRVQPTLLSHV